MPQMTDKSHLHVLGASECLVARLTKALLAKNTNDFSDITLILPTQRLGTFILASLAHRLKRACHPVRVITLEGLLWQHVSGDFSLLSEEEVIFWIGLILEEKGFSHLKVGHERELALFFNELASSGVGREAFDGFFQVLEEDIYRSDDHVGSLYERLDEIQKAYGFLGAQMAQKGYQLKSEAMAEAALDLAQNLDSSSLFRDSSEIFVAGFTSVLGSIEPLMKALSEHPKVHFWLHYGPAKSPLRGLLQLVSHGGEDFSEPCSKKGEDSIGVVTLSSPLTESYYCVEKALEWIKGGIPANQIGIIVTHEGDYREALTIATRAYSLECNIALATPLGQTVFGSFLESLFKGVWEKEAYELIFHPLVAGWLSIDKKPYAKKLLMSDGGAPMGDLFSLEKRAKDTLNGILTPLFELLKPLLEACHEAKPLSFWLQNLQQVVAAICASHFQTDDPLWRSISEAVQGFFKAADLFSQRTRPMGFAVFWQIFARRLMSQDVRTIGEPLKGVQVISLSESRHIPFAATLIVGCNEGTFPKALPSDDLVDDYIKRRIGLSGWRHLEAMEDQTFYLLKERLPLVVMTRPASRQEQKTIRSRFVETLVARGKADLIEDKRSVRDLFPDDPSFTQKALSLEGLTARKVEEDVAKVSATSLSYLLSCPYRYRLHKNRVSSIEVPGSSGDKRLEGEWLHKVIEKFFKREDFYEDFESSDFAKVASARLVMLTKKYGPPQIASDPLFLQLTYQGWPRFLEHLKVLYGKDLKKGIERSLKETTLKAQDAFITVNSVQRGISGVIDSIDHLENMTLIVDYKRKSPPPLAQVQKGLVPQLILYAAGLANGDLEALKNMVLGYWNIIDGEFLPVAAGEHARSEALSKGLIRPKTPCLLELYGRYQATWGKREDLIRAREAFYADASLCNFCDYENLCRRLEPQAGERFDNQMDLSKGRLDEL